MRRRRLAGWSLVTAAGVLSGGTVVLAAWWLPAALASGLAALTAAVTGVWLARGTQLVATAPAARPPLVRRLTDPVALGVHPAGGSAAPPYIPRDVTDELHAALRRDRFVLVVGESTAGKTRAAYEAVRALLPGHRLVEPASRADAADAVARAAAEPRSVLWLDDLERFLGTGGLTAAGVREVLAGPGRFVVATLRAEEHARFSGPRGVGEPAQEVLRAGWDVIRLATRVDLPRRWSADELARAGEHAADPRVADAVGHAADFGVAEYLASGPQLLAAWRDAWAPGTHPRAAAMVLAAVDARRVGVHRLLPHAVLTRLHEPYLTARGGARLRPEPLPDALDWATRPLYATSSLLLPGDGLLAFDYLIDAIERDPIPAEALEALIEFATPDEAQDIGEYAWGFGQLRQAHTAFRRAEDGGDWRATVRRCETVRLSDGSAAGVEFAKAVLAERGPTADARELLLTELGCHGYLSKARAGLTELLADVEAELGAEHERTLRLRVDLAHWHIEAGEPGLAVFELGGMVPVTTRVLGPGHGTTLTCRSHLAKALGHTGDIEGAIAVLDRLLADLREVAEHASFMAHAVSSRAEWLMKAEMFPEALAAMREIVADQAVTKGSSSWSSLRCRAQYAECLGRSGDAEQAVKVLAKVVSDARRGSVFQILTYDRAHAHWLGTAESPSAAAAEFARLTDKSLRLCGDRSEWPLIMRRRRGEWLVRAGRRDEARRELTALLRDARELLGEGHRLVLAIEESIATSH